MPQALAAVNDFVVKFANVNGSGSASANELFARSILRMGVPVSPRNIFPSNIQGLPTWYEVRVTEKGYLGRRGGVDMMVAMNPQTWDKDVAEIEPGGYLFYDSTKPLPKSKFRDDIHVIGMPLTEICNSTYNDPRERQLFKNIIYVGALAGMMGIEPEVIAELIGEQYKGKEKLLKPNLNAFQMGLDYAREHLKASKAAILYDQGQAYSSGLADYFEKAFKEMGGTIVTKQAYTGGNLEISSQLQSIKGSGAEVVFLPGYYSDAGTIIRKAREAGITTPFLGGDGWDSEELPKIAGDAINGNYFSNHYAPEEDRPEVKNFVESYKKEYGSTPDGLAALGYDAALVLFDAMERAPSLSGKDLRDAIAATKNFTGVTGTFSIDENRNAEKSAVIIEYKGGMQTMAARIASPDQK